MAFHADLYGYIARKEAEHIPPEVLEEIHRSSIPLFSATSFSAPAASRMGHYTSFACSVRFDAGEDDMWIAPFEMILKRINFLRAEVIIDHEESSSPMQYSYVKLDVIKKFVTRLNGQLLEESAIG
jgi:hypothetical protein